MMMNTENLIPARMTWSGGWPSGETQSCFEKTYEVLSALWFSEALYELCVPIVYTE